MDYFKRSRCPLDMMEDCELPMKKQICFASLHAIRVIPEIKGVWGMDSWAKLLKDEVKQCSWDAKDRNQSSWFSHFACIFVDN